MKELKPMEDIYLEEYDIHVRPYLSLAEIDVIVKGICAVDTNEYVDRKMTEDMLILFHGTSITKEELESVDYEALNRSGLIQAVRSNIQNLDRISECLNYMESFSRAFIMLAPKFIPLMESLGVLNGENSNNE